MFGELVYGMGPAGVWVSFVVCLLLILLTGARLSRHGNAIAVRTGLGGVWVGLVLVAAVTSLPELVTGLSAILVVGQPDLAVGAALGSCVYNLVIIAVLDFIYRPGTIYSGIQHGHSLSAGFSVVLLGAAASALFVHSELVAINVGPIGPYSIVAPIIYFIAMRSVFFYERREKTAMLGGLSGARALREAGAPPLAKSYVWFAVNALVLMAAATALPMIGEALALMMGWEETFVGTIFLAFVTSLPEIVISVEAVRIGAVDLAIGGILGSNLFDLLILAVEDFAYVDGPILAVASSQHLLTSIAALTMTGIVIVGLYSRPRARVFRVVSWASLGLLIVAVFTALFLFLLG